MLSTLTEGPLLWFLNRGTGIALLLVLTASLALGLFTAGRRSGGIVPAFVPQTLHRNLSLLALALVVLHIVTAVADTFVDIRWWQALVPWGAAYEPFWLGLGTLAFDVMLVVSFTTALRGRLSPRAWHRVHLLGYASWPVAFAHGAGMGTDATEPWAQRIALGCLVVVLVALTARVTRRSVRRSDHTLVVTQP